MGQISNLYAHDEVRAKGENLIAHVNGLVSVLDSVRTGHETEEQAHADLAFGLRVLDGVIHEFTSSVHALLA